MLFSPVPRNSEKSQIYIVNHVSRVRGTPARNRVPLWGTWKRTLQRRDALTSIINSPSIESTRCAAESGKKIGPVASPCPAYFYVNTRLHCSFRENAFPVCARGVFVNLYFSLAPTSLHCSRVWQGCGGCGSLCTPMCGTRCLKRRGLYPLGLVSGCNG